MSSIVPHLDQQHCRYLACPASGIDGRFRQLLRELGLMPPPDLEVTELVRYGWIKPILRVELPRSFYLSWENFPSYPVFGTLAQEDSWASHLWALGAIVRRGSADPQSETWYRHFLDVPDHWVTQSALAHQLPTDGSREPESFEHPGPPRVRTIHPWIDFFAYWQTYHIAEILHAVYIDIAPRLPGARQKVEALLARVDQLEEYAQSRLSALRKRWEERSKVFDWLSRLHTVIGIWRHEYRFPGDGWNEERFEVAAKAMIVDMGLDAKDLMRHIRDHLLVLWSDWRNAPSMDPPMLLLQRDIELAVWLVGLINGKPVPYDDPFWGYPADRMLREWAPLPSVLPYETDEAKREFPWRAEIALDGSAFNQVVPQEMRINEASIEKLTDKWWPRSAAFRRFALAYNRLYRHHVGKINEQRLVGIEAETPIEFLILCALHVEKLLGERLGPSPPTEFNKRVREVARRIARRYGIQDQKAFLDELTQALNDKTQLHDLPQRTDNPFVEEADFQHPERVGLFFLKVFVNFKILRNYSAHHDCIDAQLFQEGWVAAGVEALVVTTLTTLSISTQ